MPEDAKVGIIQLWLDELSEDYVCSIMMFTNPQSIIFTDFSCKLICLLSGQQKLVNRICKRRLKNFFPVSFVLVQL